MLIVGVDEVGRGAWAGPVVAAAVILGKPIASLKDSKLLSKKRRPELAEQITQTATAVGIGWVWPKQIDEWGLTKAIASAMAAALKTISVTYDQIIIDGAYNFLADNPKTVALVKADQSVPAVSAASIIAKVARDDYMIKIAKDLPNYFFEKHVGYGTKLHQAMLRDYGHSQIHRLSYRPLKELVA